MTAAVRHFNSDAHMNSISTLARPAVHHRRHASRFTASNPYLSPDSGMVAPVSPAARHTPPSPEALLTALQTHFGHDSFRPHQCDAVTATLSGRDSLLVLPTGGGKSLAFQLPPLASGRNCFSVVVGPLMALAKDQVRLSDAGQCPHAHKTERSKKTAIIAEHV